MKQYHAVLEEVRRFGWEEPDDRTGVGRLRWPGASKMRFDLREGFPLVTTKRVPFRWVAEELFWFLSGDTNEATLRAKGVDIWQEWADEAHTARFGREPGDLGPIYGYVWRSFGGDYPERNGIDQIARAIDEIRTRPASTRILVTGWDPRVADAVDLPPCHTLFQFYVERGRVLHLQLFQRSADLFLGVPFNIASYALLAHLVAHVCDLEVGNYFHSFGDAHIYFNHFEQVETLLSREPLPPPRLEIVDPDGSLRGGGLDALLRFRWEHLKLIGYRHHGTIAAPVAV
ncbi:MAG TPA: thymidylate synthase [Longimicrobiales bacterium]